MKLFMLLWFAVFNLWAQNIHFTNLPDGQIQVVGKGFDKGSRKYQVNFYKYSDFLKQVLTNSNGSFSYTSPKNTFNYGDKIVVKVLQYKGSSSHWTDSWEYRRRISDPTPPRPTPTPDIPYSKLKSYADQQARTVANKVVATYGMRENFKYNFTQGFWDGYKQFKRWGSNTYYGHQYYKRGVQVGREQGQREGYAKGLNHGQGMGKQAGKSDAKSRFVQAVDRGTPDLTLNIPNPNFSGFQGNYYVPSIQEKLDELERDFRSDLRRYYWESGNWYLNDWDVQWTLRSVYRDEGNYRFVDSWFRADYAYKEWMSNRLGGGYDKNIYNRLSYEQKSTFQNLFKQIYNQVIDAKFYRVKTRYNSSWRNLGERYGNLVGKEMAVQEGIRDGILATFQAASVEGFRESYADSYGRSFEETANYFSNNAVIEILEAKLIGDFLPRAPIGVKIFNIRNIGGVAFNGMAKLSGDGITNMSINEEVSLDAHSSNRGEVIIFENLASIGSNTAFDMNHFVTLSVGTKSKQLKYSFSWEKVLNAYFACNPNEDTDHLESYIMATIKKEWLDQKGTMKNLYKKDESQSFLGRMVLFIEKSSTCSDLRKMARELEMIPGRVAWSKFTLKTRKKAFLKLVDRIK